MTSPSPRLAHTCSKRCLTNQSCPISLTRWKQGLTDRAYWYTSLELLESTKLRVETQLVDMRMRVDPSHQTWSIQPLSCRRYDKRGNACEREVPNALPQRATSRTKTSSKKREYSETGVAIDDNRTDDSIDIEEELISDIVAEHKRQLSPSSRLSDACGTSSYSGQLQKRRWDIERRTYPMSAVAGNTAARTALCLAAVNPALGVLILGPRGTGKTGERELAQIYFST